MARSLAPGGGRSRLDLIEFHHATNGVGNRQRGVGCIDSRQRLGRALEDRNRASLVQINVHEHLLGDG